MTSGLGPERPDAAPLLDRSTAANVVWLSVERLIALALQLAAGLLVVRHLGPERFGLLSWSTALVWMFVPLVGLGIDDLARRAWSVGGTEIRAGFVARLVRLRMGVAVFCVAVVVAVSVVAAPSGARIGTALLSLGLVGHALTTFSLPFEVELESRHVARLRLASLVGVALWQLVGVLASAPLLWFYVAALLGLVLPGLAAWWAYRGHFGRERRTPLRGPTARQVAPFLVAAVATGVTMRVDQIMLEVVRGVEAVGIYAAAARVSEAPYFLPVVLAASLFGRTARASAAERQVRAMRTFDLQTVLAVGAAGALALSAPVVVDLAFGEAYRGAIDVLRIHALGIVPLAWSVTRWQLLVVEGQQRYGAIAAAAGALANIMLNAVFIPRWGASGAAAGTVISLLFETVVVGLLVRQLREATGMMVRSTMKVPSTAWHLGGDTIRWLGSRPRSGR